MSSFWNSFFGRPEPRRNPAPAAPNGPADPALNPAAQPPQQFATAPGGSASAAELQTRLTKIVRDVNEAGGRMPEGGVPAVREVEDVLRPLLTYLQANPATETEMLGVRAMLEDYLPTTIDSFLKLPAHFATTHRNPAGRTPADELLVQLELLADGAQEYATAIYAGDAQRLSNQGRFLHDKFARSELQL